MPRIKKTKTVPKTANKPAVKVSYMSLLLKNTPNIRFPKKPDIKILAKKQFIIPLVIVVIIALLYYFKGLFVVATVNGQPITSIALINEMKKESGKQSLNSLVSESLILQEAHKQNITISDKDIDGQINTLESSLTSQGQNLDDVLSQRGMTRNDLRDQIKVQLIVDKMLGSKVTVTDKEINDYYNQNKSSLPSTMDEKSAKASIKQQLRQQKIASAFQTWISGLEQKAKINYFVNL